MYMFWVTSLILKLNTQFSAMLLLSFWMTFILDVDIVNPIMKLCRMDGYDVSLLDTSWFYREEAQRYKNIEVWFSKFKCWIWRMTKELWLIGSIGWHTVINWDFHHGQMFQSAILKTLFLNLLKHWGCNDIHKDLWRNRCWWTMLVLNPNTIQWTNVLDILYVVNARDTLLDVGHFIKVWTTRKRVRWDRVYFR